MAGKLGMAALAEDSKLLVLQFLDLQSLGRMATTSTGMHQLVENSDFAIEALVAPYLAAHAQGTETKEAAEDELKALFGAQCRDPDTTEHKLRQKAVQQVCVRSLETNIANTQQFLDLAHHCIRCEFNEALKDFLSARYPSLDTKKDKESQEPLLLGNQSAFMKLTQFAINLSKEEAVKCLVSSGVENGILDAPYFAQSVAEAASHGLTSLVAFLLSQAVRANAGSMDTLALVAMHEACKASHAALALNMAKMLCTRFAHAQETMDMRHRAPGFVVDAAALAERDALAARKTKLVEAIIKAVQEATRQGNLDLVQAFLNEKIITRDMALCIQKTAARNGLFDIVMLLRDCCGDDALYDLFDDAVRRNHNHSVSCLLETGIFARAYLEGQRRQADLRECDDVAAILDAYLRISPANDADQAASA
ncbi:Hypothetical Protein FCC1311_042802 [Hondaea fermentalgiana]|uniref:F-box domain-containing protein n=1 Tax=Hondaea fermentalgiana TaxID=2315210 RepID=A0A2R5GAM6_9STRA|nr:Hypothetical Protein FCC1311_042802 [Hondaea fermentalgiana]|eukprot:GBG28057.1 Hypothetical Protein FCC1311_042802 [Hondaea fermentalgiana]